MGMAVNIWNVLHLDRSGHTPPCFLDLPYETSAEGLARNWHFASCFYRFRGALDIDNGDRLPRYPAPPLERAPGLDDAELRTDPLRYHAPLIETWARWMFHPNPTDVYRGVAWLGFVPNLLLAEWLIRRRISISKALR
jgi:hypothetical protein